MAARRGLRYDTEMPDRNTQWLIGAVLAFAALFWTQQGATNARLDEIGARLGRLEVAVDNNRAEIRDLRSEMSALRTELQAQIRELDARLRAVEIELGKVNQRLATLERAVLPAAPPAG